MPSKYEGLPLVMVEAQCSGLKCFMSDTITDEICLSENVKKLSIRSNASLWATAIFETKISTYENQWKRDCKKSRLRNNRTSRET